MSKLELNDITNIFTAAATLNENNARIEAALENTLSRDGTSPNEMNTDLDMNHRRIYNLPAPQSETEPVRLEEVQPILDRFDDLEAAVDAAEVSQSNAENAAQTALEAAQAAEDAVASVQIVDQATAEAGLDNTGLMSPLRVAQHIGFNLGITRGQIATRAIPLTCFLVTGESAANDRGAGAVYVRGTSGGLRAIQDAAGTWWNWSPGTEVNVCHAGAVGDGTDATSAFLLAASVVPDGGTLRIPAGSYRKSELLSFDDMGVAVIGAGSSVSRIIEDGGDGGLSVSNSENTKRSYIKGLMFEAATAGAGTAVYTSYSTHTGVDDVMCLIDDVQCKSYDNISGYWTKGFVNNGAKWSILSNCYARGINATSMQVGFELDGVDNVGVRFSNCSVLGALDGLRIGGSVEGVYINGMELVYVTNGINRQHLTNEPVTSATNLHINCLSRGLIMKKVIQSFFNNVQIYANGDATGHWVGVEITDQLLADIDLGSGMQINGAVATSAASRTGVSVAGSSRVFGTLNLSGLDVGVRLGAGVTETAFTLIHPIGVTTLFDDQSGNNYNRLSVVETDGFYDGVPRTLVNWDTSNTANKAASLFLGATDTAGTVKPGFALATVSADSNVVSAQTFVRSRKADALVDVVNIHADQISVIPPAFFGIGSRAASAALQIESSDKGFLPPRMNNTQNAAISNPAEGLMIYNYETKKWRGYNGTAWVDFN